MIAFGVRANNNLSIFNFCQQHEFNAQLPRIKLAKCGREFHAIIRHPTKKNIHAQCWAQWCIPQVNQNYFFFSEILYFFPSTFTFIKIFNRNVDSFRKLHATLHNFKWNEMKRSVENDITRGQRPMILFVLHTVHVSLLACSPVFSTNMNTNGRCFFFFQSTFDHE